MQELETYSVPIIPVAHLTEEVAQQLANDGDQNMWAVLVAPYQNGLFLLATNQMYPSSDWPQCVAAVYAWAREHDFYMVRLDSDATPVEGLPIYDW